jgi:hypothetical protein
MNNDTPTGPIPPADAVIIVPDYLRPDYEALRDSGHSVAYCLDRLGLAPERGGDGRCSRRNGERPPFADAVWAGDPSMCQRCAGTGHLYGDLEGDICSCPDLTPNPTPANSQQ